MLVGAYPPLELVLPSEVVQSHPALLAPLIERGPPIPTTVDGCAEESCSLILPPFLIAGRRVRRECDGEQCPMEGLIDITPTASLALWRH